MLKAQNTIFSQRNVKSSDCPCQQQGFARWYLLLSLLHILHPSMTMLNVEVAASCCSRLIEMVRNVSARCLRRDFSPSSSPFYSLNPAVLMLLSWSSEYLVRLTVDCTFNGDCGTVQGWRLYWVCSMHSCFTSEIHTNIKQPHKIHTWVSPYALGTVWCSTPQ